MAVHDMVTLDLSWPLFQTLNSNTSSSFEAMCLDLFTATFVQNGVCPHANSNNPGLEVDPVPSRFTKDGKPLLVSYQSKFFIGRTRFDEIWRSMKNTIRYYSGRVDRVYLFCNNTISVNSKTYKKMDFLLNEANIELCPVTNNDIFSLLRKYPTIIRHYFTHERFLNAEDEEASIHTLTEANLVHFHESECKKKYEALKRNLSNILSADRKKHPSFKLMDKEKVDEILLPKIKDLENFPIFESVAKESDSEAESPVWKLILKSWTLPNKHNIIILGEGGIGKTVTLLNFTNDIPQVPAIYIPLHRLVSKDGECSSISKFLEEKYSKYHNEIDTLAAESWENGPRLLLLLDGFNEVPDLLRGTILQNVEDWDSTHPGAQLIAVSRPTTGYSLNRLSADSVKITLQPLNKYTVRSYLTKCGAAIPNDSSPIWKDLVYPLFLTLYVKTDRLLSMEPAGYSLAPKQAKSGGALIWNFLQRELLRNDDDLKKSEDWVIHCALACEYIIPYIAYRMAKSQRFGISTQDAKIYIDEAVKLLDISAFPRHLHNLYQEYLGRNTKYPDLTTIEWTPIVLQSTGILVRPEKTDIYAFMHQNFRDCLAGLYLVNQAEIAEKCHELYPTIWQESHHPDLIEYASELMEEKTFNYLWEQNRSLHPVHHTGTINLLELRRYQNKQNTLNFSTMDLCDLSLARYMKNDQNDLSLFRKEKLTVDTRFNLSTFKTEGHEKSVNRVAVTSDGLCISGSDDKTLRVWNPHSGECLHVLEGHKDTITCVAVTPDDLCISGSYDCTLRVWNPHSGECLHVLEGHKDAITCVAVTLDGLCISGSYDHTLRVWDPHSGKCLHVLEENEFFITCVAVTPDSLCISGSYDTLRVWNPHSGECLHILRGHKSPVTCVTVTHDGLCISGSDDKTLRVWNPHSGECLHVLEGHEGFVTCVTITPDNLCVSGSYDHTLRVWNPHTEECLHILKGHKDHVYRVAISPDGMYISGSDDHTLRVWNPHTEECLHILKGHEGSIECVAVTPDGLCVSGSRDHTLRIWNLNSGESLHIFEVHKIPITCIAITPDSLCISGYEDKALRVWNPHSGECLHMLEGHKDTITCVAVTPDGLCISGSDDNTLRVWNPHSGECLHVLEGHEGSIECVAVTPNSLCVSGSYDHTLRVWDPHSGECLHVLYGHTLSVNSVAITPEGMCISCSRDDTQRIWNLYSGKCLHILKEHKYSVTCMAVTPDGLCVSGSRDGTLRVWDPHSGKCFLVLYGHEDHVKCIAITPDGLCVSVSWDHTLRIWNLHSGECLHILKEHNESFTCVAVSSDSLCVSGTSDGTLCIWNPRTGKFLHAFNDLHLNIRGMNLSKAIMDKELKMILSSNGVIV